MCEDTKLDGRAEPHAGVPHAEAAGNPQSEPHPLDVDGRQNRARRRSSRLTRPESHDPQADAPNDAEANDAVGYDAETADPQLVHPAPFTTTGAGLALANIAELSSKSDAFTREPPVP